MPWSEGYFWCLSNPDGWPLPPETQGGLTASGSVRDDAGCGTSVHDREPVVDGPDAQHEIPALVG